MQRKTVVVVLGLWQGTGPRATGRTLQGPGCKVTMVVTVALRPPRCQGTGIRVAPKAPVLIAVVGRTPTPIQNRHVTPHGNPERMVATFKNRPVCNLGTMTIRNTLDQEILRIANARSAKQLPRVSLCLSACARSSGLSNYIYIYIYVVTTVLTRTSCFTEYNRWPMNTIKKHEASFDPSGRLWT